MSTKMIYLYNTLQVVLLNFWSFIAALKCRTWNWRFLALFLHQPNIYVMFSTLNQVCRVFLSDDRNLQKTNHVTLKGAYQKIHIVLYIPFSKALLCTWTPTYQSSWWNEGRGRLQFRHNLLWTDRENKCMGPGESQGGCGRCSFYFFLSCFTNYL